MLIFLPGFSRACPGAFRDLMMKSSLPATRSRVRKISPI